MNKNSELIDELLRKTARSFYLTIHALPKAIRYPMSVAYLLARATDTMADVGYLSVHERLSSLDMMMVLIHSGPDAQKLKLLETYLSHFSPDSAEYDLLSNFNICVESMYTLDDSTRSDIKEVLDTIVKGQRLDIERLQSSTGNACLQTMKELDNYTYLVAGCVGEFWTKICDRHIVNYSCLPTDKLYSLGIAFGKGLQLVNILRDIPQDLAHGRCYLPQEQLQQYGLNLDEITLHIEKLKPLVDHWLKQAIADLQDGWKYMLSINNRRIRSS